MPVTLTTHDQILKEQFLELLKNQVNTKSDVLYNLIKASNKNIEGYKVIKSAPYGINGGAGAGTETGALPTAGGNYFKKLESTVKNYYGQIQIGDKVMKATQSNKGAFIDALVSEMEGLKEACSFMYGRDLYNDSTGLLVEVSVMGTPGLTITCDDVKYMIEGMMIDVLDNGTKVAIANGSARRIVAVDRVNKTITIDSTGGNVQTGDNDYIVTQGSYNNSLTGLKDIFKDTGSIYGADRATYTWLVPVLDTSFGAISDADIQAKIAEIEDFRGGKVNYIGIATNVEGFYITYLESTRRNVNMMEVAGGYKAIAFKDIPMKRNRFLLDGYMDLLDTSKFTFHVLSDWDWISNTGGGILQQVPGYPYYSASIAKYAELICDHPGAQCRCTGVLTPA
ncbi:MAG: phage major capsid protein [Candidatus Methanomethylophilaceae archaeon]|jgi:hypothetical protein